MLPAAPSASRRRASRPPPPQRRAAAAIGVACLALAGYLSLHQRDESRLRTAAELGLQGHHAQSQSQARRVTRAPAAGRALLTQAHAAQARGRHRDAAELFRRASEQNPRSWSLHRDWAISLLALGQRREARKQIDLASTLNPRLQAPHGF